MSYAPVVASCPPGDATEQDTLEYRKILSSKTIPYGGSE